LHSVEFIRGLAGSPSALVNFVILYYRISIHNHLWPMMAQVADVPREPELRLTFLPTFVVYER
jgi:hypothetical protein